MTDSSARFAWPFIAPGQAQKELFHNEALAAIDFTLHAAAEAIGSETPPSSPAIGQCWVLGASPSPSGAWAGRAHAIAAWTAGGWRFVDPVTGMAVWSIADEVDARWNGTNWTVGSIAAGEVRIGGLKVVGGQASAVADPLGGTTIDTQARAVLSAVLAALRGHGLIAS